MGGWRRRIGLVAFAVAMALLLSGCKKNSPTEMVGGEVLISVKSTFGSRALDGIPVTLDCEGKASEGKTQGGAVRFQLETMATCIIKVNFTNSQAQRNQDYIPAVIENIALSGGENLQIDLAEVNKLNPNNSYSWKELLKAYRGRDYIDGVNQVWTRQPEKWIIWDPKHYLDKYPDPKNNPIFDNIMRGFRAIQEYTNGFITAPSRDDVEIRHNGTAPDYSINFTITNGDAYADEYTNSNNEIIKSTAGAGPTGHFTIIEELTSSVQGGDNDSTVGVFNWGEIRPIDKIWGKFNYFKRKPGDKFYLDGPYGHLYEVRKIE